MENIKHQVKITLFVVISAILLTTFALALSGCTTEEQKITTPDTQETQDAGVEKDDIVKPVLPEKEPRISFEVPKEWMYRNEQSIGGPSGATWTVNSNIGQTQDMSLEIHNIYVGNDKEAEEISRHRYEGSICNGKPNCKSVEGWPPSKFKVIKLASGVTLYGDIAPMSIDKFRYSRDEESPYSWGSDFTFSKGGYVFDTYLSDRIDLYTKDFELITRTLKIEE